MDVFHFADFWLPRFGRTDEPGYQLDILAASPGPVRTHSGIEIVATQSCYDIKDGLDTLVVSGGINAEQACKDDPALVEWVHAIAPRVRRVASICTGAFILAAAGLLNHRRVTTHWLFSELLAKLYPSVQVDSNLLFARDGNIYTSGEITAGIDLLRPDFGRSPRPCPIDLRRRFDRCGTAPRYCLFYCADTSRTHIGKNRHPSTSRTCPTFFRDNDPLRRTCLQGRCPAGSVSSC